MKFLLEITYDIAMNMSNPMLQRTLAGAVFLFLACMIIILLVSLVVALCAVKDYFDAKSAALYEAEPDCEANPE